VKHGGLKYLAFVSLQHTPTKKKKRKKQFFYKLVIYLPFESNVTLKLRKNFDIRASHYT
jgi:hypothetical protein